MALQRETIKTHTTVNDLFMNDSVLLKKNKVIKVFFTRHLLIKPPIFNIDGGGQCCVTCAQIDNVTQLTCTVVISS